MNTRRQRNARNTNSTTTNGLRNGMLSAQNRANNGLLSAQNRANGLSALPLSGSERPFTVTTFGSHRGKGNNNCYAWAIDKYRNDGGVKLQPGNLSGSKDDLNLASCRSVMTRALADLGQDAYAAPAETRCRPGFYKVMSFLSPGQDYHWYRQHKDLLVQTNDKVRTADDVARYLGVPSSRVYSPSRAPRSGDTLLVKNTGLWSHKRGFATEPILKDACDKPIMDPRRACRRYSHDLDYKEYCGALCVRSTASAIATAAALNITNNKTIYR